MDGEFDGVEWDERKSARNALLRGFGFDFAAHVFLGDYLEEENRNEDFGEQRFVAVGAVGSVILAVIWTPRGSCRRIISARPASRRERKIYRGYCEKETF